MTVELTDREMDQLETEEEFLAKYDLGKYAPKGLTADLCIFTIRDEKLSILLIRRGGHPEKGKLALPGGFVNNDETVEQAAHRELLEETNVEVGAGFLEQLQTYSGPDRDPRGYITSVAYVALIPEVMDPVAADDAAEAKFLPVYEVLSDPDQYELGFDHHKIITDAVARVQAKLEYSPIATAFIKDDEITVSELRNVYEIVLNTELNRSNFRRKVRSIKGWLTPTGEKKTPEIKGGRLSDTYKVNDIDIIYPPLRLLP